MSSTDPKTLEKLPTIIGAERLTPYLAACDADPACAVRLYSWNIEASCAVLGAFAALEVGIRNAMHDALVKHFRRTDWWNSAPLSPLDRSAVDDAARHLNRKKGVGSWTAGHLVAELRTSFWEGLLANRHHAALWVPALAGAFPNLTGRRSHVRDRLERLRLLRNRAAHHEPIHARDLTVDHRYMCELAGYVAVDLAAWIRSYSRLPTVIAARASTVDGSRSGTF